VAKNEASGLNCALWSVPPRKDCSSHHLLVALLAPMLASNPGRRHLRVQVKSTVRCLRGNAFSLRVAGAKSQPYAAGDIDFLAAFRIPLEEWYIVPWAELKTSRGPLRTLYLSTQSRLERRRPFRDSMAPPPRREAEAELIPENATL
jgi:hypothetical protein